MGCRPRPRGRRGRRPRLSACSLSPHSPPSGWHTAAAAASRHAFLVASTRKRKRRPCPPIMPAGLLRAAQRRQGLSPRPPAPAPLPLQGRHLPFPRTRHRPPDTHHGTARHRRHGPASPWPERSGAFCRSPRHGARALPRR
jgi:hypothetical protein